MRHITTLLLFGALLGLILAPFSFFAQSGNPISQTASYDLWPHKMSLLEVFTHPERISLISVGVAVLALLLVTVLFLGAVVQNRSALSAMFLRAFGTQRAGHGRESRAKASDGDVELRLMNVRTPQITSYANLLGVSSLNRRTLHDDMMQRRSKISVAPPTWAW